MFVVKIQPLSTGTKLNLGDRVLGEAEKNSFIALPGKVSHGGLILSRLCVHLGEGSQESYSYHSRSRVVDTDQGMCKACICFSSIDIWRHSRLASGSLLTASVVLKVMELWPSLWDEECLQRMECEVVVHLLIHVQLSATLWTAACQALLSFTVSQSLLKLVSTVSVMPSNHLFHPLSQRPFSSCPQSFPASESFPGSQLFGSGGQSVGASASVLPMNIQGWFPLGSTGLISLLSMGSPRVFSSTTVGRVQKRKISGAETRQDIWKTSQSELKQINAWWKLFELVFINLAGTSLGDKLP